MDTRSCGAECRQSQGCGAITVSQGHTRVSCCWNKQWGSRTLNVHSSWHCTNVLGQNYHTADEVKTVTQRPGWEHMT